jgi:tetratricopeptide (TPR) repeat protein
MKRIYCIVFAFCISLSAWAQQTPASATPEPSPAAAKPAPAPRKVDRAAAYYHYTLAHLYEEQVAMYGRSELVTKAIEEYRLAIDADPGSEYLTSALAELYTRAGRIRDAVLEAQDILKRDPNNLEAHKLLGRIYLKSLGDVQAGNASDSVLKLAIEQWEQIVKLEPDNVDDRLLLGRLYKVNNDLRKAEDEFKTAVKRIPRTPSPRWPCSIPKRVIPPAPPKC